MGPRSLVFLALLVITALGCWCLDCATLEVRARGGDASAQYRFGKQALECAKTAPDYARAVEWIRLAADQGDAKAQTGLGLLYLRGLRLQRDYSEANKWLRRAADQGLALAQNELGIVYAKGMGVPQDLEQAAFWCGKAAAQGSTVAKRNLALVQLVKRSSIANLTTSDGRLHKNVTLQSVAPDGITVKLQVESGSVVLAKLKFENLTGQFKELCGYTGKDTTNSAFSQLDSITVRL